MVVIVYCVTDFAGLSIGHIFEVVVFVWVRGLRFLNTLSRKLSKMLFHHGLSTQAYALKRTQIDFSLKIYSRLTTQLWYGN